MDYQNQIFSLLKDGSGHTLDNISNILGIDKTILFELLQQLIKDGYILLNSDKYYLKNNLNSALNGPETEPNHYYSINQGSIIPDEWTNPNYQHIARRFQDSRQICVGVSAAYGRDLDILKLTNDYPTNDEISGIKRYVTESNGLLHDILFVNHSISAESIYQYSRQIAGISSNPKGGSLVSAAVESLKQIGCNLEKDCITSLNDIICPLSQINKEKAISHKIDGYIGIKDFDEIKKAIYTYGYVLMPINIYSNYTKNGCSGLFPNPSGNLVGSHALIWIGYTKDTLICLNSWREWEFIGGITREYYLHAAGTAFAVIDSSELKIISQNFAKIRIESNVPIQCYINSVLTSLTDRSLILSKGNQYIIRVVSESETIEKEMTKTITISEDQIITFRFTLPQSPEINKVIQQLREKNIRDIS